MGKEKWLIDFEPDDEAGVRTIFDIYHEKLGYLIVRSRGDFPDYRLRDIETRRIIRAEAEVNARNYKVHGHDLKQCDLIRKVSG